MESAPRKEYEQLVTNLLSTAQHNMTQSGFDFGTGRIVAQWPAVKRKKVGPVKLNFPSVTLARAFHYQYKDGEWDSDTGAHTILIRLKHDQFDREMLDPATRVAVGSVPAITPLLVRQIVNTPLAN